MNKFSFLFLIAFLFVGCSIKEDIIYSKPLHVIIKNEKLRINDTGFINKKNNSINLQIFSAATPILNLHVKKENICIGYTCLAKKSFNQEFLSNAHYENIIEDILEFQPIYQGKNMIKNELGFSQKILEKDIDILYKVENKTLYFKDRKNKILIKIRELGE